ncbi:hypothetical protein GGH96_005749 [Coemansia sp. RSA 1972]|nr:hypothetical protein GGH96_005749 [Coemansia sp. RSA 1972]
MSCFATNIPTPFSDRVVFVPDYVNMNALDKCLQDNRVTFIPISTLTFDAQVEHKTRLRFLLLEKDHFVAHVNGNAPVKCNYEARNKVMSEFWLGQIYHVTSDLKQVNGLWVSWRPLVHFFVYEGANSLQSECTALRNTVFEYASTDDFGVLAEIVKRKPHCEQKYFGVNNGQTYTLVNADDVEQKYEFSRLNLRTLGFKLWKKETTVQSLIDEETQLAAFRPNQNRQPGFKLRDADGREIADGEPFMLHIVNYEHEPESDMDDELDDIQEDERQFYGKVWIEAMPSAGQSPCFVSGALHNGTRFHAETIDGIVHIKNEKWYLNTHLDPMDDCLYSDIGVPDKDNRIQIHYDEDGNIRLSAWGGRTYADYEWMGDGGMITFGLEETYLGQANPLKLRIVRL